MIRAFLCILLLLIFGEPVIRDVVHTLQSMPSAGVLFGVFLAGAALTFTIRRAFIHNALVESDRKADHAGVDKKHDSRRV